MTRQLTACSRTLQCLSTTRKPNEFCNWFALMSSKRRSGIGFYVRWVDDDDDDCNNKDDDLADKLRRLLVRGECKIYDVDDAFFWLLLSLTLPEVFSWYWLAFSITLLRYSIWCAIDLVVLFYKCATSQENDKLFTANGMSSYSNWQ